MHPSDPRPADRRWRFWQVESTLACDLTCVMCPWRIERMELAGSGHMSDEVWERLRPHLPDTAAVDFSGGGEPLLHPALEDRIADARAAGCRTGFLTNGVGLVPGRVDRLLEAGVDWIGVSIDAATPLAYERVRPGASFASLCGNLAGLSRRKTADGPLLVVNVVLMAENIDRLGALVGLVAELGADEIVFKQCDVIRGEQGRGRGLFGPAATPSIRHYERRLGAAERLARRLGLGVRSHAFLPDELPVCAQDPRRSLFVRHDGRVSPCIGLARGGLSEFLGEGTYVSTVSFGDVRRRELPAIWETDACRSFRAAFDARVRAHDARLRDGLVDDDPFATVEALDAAVREMPPAPEPCRTCHYLYDV